MVSGHGPWRRRPLLRRPGYFLSSAVGLSLRLIAGYHRLEACKRLGMDKIQANVRKVDEVHAELAEIDENLIRNELTALERCEQLARSFATLDLESSW